MKRISTLFIYLMLFLFQPSFTAYADGITISVTPTDPTVPINDESGRGKRIPTRPIFCNIDFETGTISSTSSLINNVAEYQICTEDSACIYSTDSEAEFVNALKNLHGVYIITLIGDGYALSGYFEN